MSAASAAENAMNRRSLSGHPTPSGCRYGWLLAMPNAIDQRDLADTGQCAGARGRRARPVAARRASDRLVLKRGREVVGQHDLDVDALSAQFADQPGSRGGEPADPGQRGELGRREQHLHDRSVQPAL